MRRPADLSHRLQHLLDPTLLRRLLFLAPLALAASPALAHVRITTDLTFSEDVRPILRRYCMGCHSPSGSAPSYVDLRTYGTDSAPGARAWGAAIEEELLTGRMPPWQADPRFDEFANSRRPTKAEIDTVVGWIRGGGPQGPQRDLPPPPEFEDGAWQLGEPDRVIEPSEAAVLPADAQEGSHAFEIPVEIDEDTWVTGFEFRPEHPRTVYRMAAWIVDPPAAEPEKLEVEIQVPYDPFKSDKTKGPSRWYPMPLGEHFLGQWLRGDSPVLLPAGMGYRLRRGSTVRLQVDYRRIENDPAEKIEDRSRLGLYLAGSKDEVDLILESRRSVPEADLPAEDRRWLKEETKRRHASGAPLPRRVLDFDQKVRLVSLAPNFSTAVQDVEVDLLYPDGLTDTLLVIEDYDPAWPASYLLRQPIEVPPGSRLLVAGRLRDGASAAPEGGGGAPGEPFDVEVGYAIDDHLVLPPPERVVSAPQSQGGMLIGANLGAAADLLKSSTSAAPGAPADPRAAAHMDHSPLHGGQFFMAANGYHHLEGSLPKPGEFHLYVYDDFKKPLDPRNFAGDVVYESYDKAKEEWSETSYPLVPGEPGSEFLRAEIPDTMPAEFFASVWLAGEKARFDFYFEEPSRELSAAELARYAALGPHSHQRPPLQVPESAKDVVAELGRRTELLRELVKNGDWLALHVPAFDAIDLARALLDKLDGLSARDRGRVREAVSRTLQSAAELDRAGDLADSGRATRAFARYDEAWKTLRGVF